MCVIKKIVPVILLIILCLSVNNLLDKSPATTGQISNTEKDIKFKRVTIDPPPQLIAHGGGIIIRVDGKDKRVYSTNSIEALQRNYDEGYSLFEMDFQWTSDNHLVAIHDWGTSWRAYYEKEDRYYYQDRDLKQEEAPTLKQRYDDGELPKYINLGVNNA